MEIIIKPNTKDFNSYINCSINSFILSIKEFSLFSNIFFTLDEIKKLKTTYPNIKIYLSINKNFFNSDLKDLKELLIEIEKLKIEGILYYDLGILNIVKKEKLNINLIWNQNYFVTNYESINYYYDLGVKNAVISSEITIDEITEIIEKSKSKLFINIFGYQIMSFSKRYLISNYLKYINEENNNKEHFIIEDNKKYKIIETKDGSIILTNYILSGIKYINKLKGISFLIFDEYDIDNTVFIKIIQLFNKKQYKEIDKLIETNTSFFEKKTIYKVKDNG